MKYGPLAHLVERFDGIEEVRGSIPLRSTIVLTQASKLPINFLHQLL